MDACIFERILQSFKDVPEVDARAKVGPRAFVIALITAVVNDTGKRGIPSLRRTLIGSLGETLACSTFWQRLSSKRLTEILSQVIRQLVDGISSEIASLSLADTPSSNRQIILNIVLAAITSYLIAQPLASASLSKAIPEVQAAFSIQRAAKIFVQVASDVREYLISATEKTLIVLQEKMERFVPELIDPNYRSRATSMRRLAVL